MCNNIIIVWLINLTSGSAIVKMCHLTINVVLYNIVIVNRLYDCILYWAPFWHYSCELRLCWQLSSYKKSTAKCIFTVLEILPDDFSHQRKVSYHQQ